MNKEKQMEAMSEYLAHMEDTLTELIGEEMLDRYLYTNMIYIGMQLQEGYHTPETLVQDGLDGLEIYL